MTLADDEIDAHVDTEIDACLNLHHPKSFFLFAGAGSGKTHSLVTALAHLRKGNSRRLKLQRRRIAVITYTNAVCDEIKQRLQYDPLIEVSTIHSFVWNLIQNLHTDIKQWVEANLRQDIEELKTQQVKGRASQASVDRARKLESKERRLKNLSGVKQFTYSPTGDNRGRDSLNHAEVIQIGANFLTKRPLMQSILVNRFPVLLIDESQDTNKSLMDAFFLVQSASRERFALGLFGDSMQRIYTDGKPSLGENLPADWAKPVKVMNHRCPKRVVKLINQIRSSVDGQTQQARSDKEEGFVRLFLLPNGTTNKPAAELAVRCAMAKATGDALWSGEHSDVKTLMLEHLMAARRMGFVDLYQPLAEADGGALQTSLREGTLTGIRFFSDVILPLRKAAVRGDQFAIAAIVRDRSPLLSKAILKVSAQNAQSPQISLAQTAVAELNDLWSQDSDPTLISILGCIRETGLFELPESLQLILPADAVNAAAIETPSTLREERDPILAAWDVALNAPFSQVESYTAYVRGEAPFGTHQGIKGLEFPRVLVVMDDSEARGFLFSYEKLFGAAPKSTTDLKNEQSGLETSLDRTRRLLYVTCSRAVSSLALVAYSANPSNVRDQVLREGWFAAGEILMASQFDM